MISMTSGTQQPSRTTQLRSSVLGVDIGCSAIKMARMESSLGRWTVTNRLVIPMEESAASFTETLSDGVLARQLAILKDRPLGSIQECVCVLPRAVCDIRSVDVPAGTDAEVKQQAVDTLRAHFGDQFENRTYQMWRHCISATELTTVSCASVESSISEHIVQELESVGLKCVGIESQPIAVARACRLSRIGQSETPIGILDWGHSNASFVIVLKGQPQLVRTFQDCSGGSAVRMISNGLSVPAADALQILAGCGLPAKPDKGRASTLSENLQQFIMPVLQKVSAEIQQTLSHIRHHIPALMPGRVLLMGGMGSISNMAPVLQHQCGIETTPWTLDTEHAHASDPIYSSSFAASALQADAACG